MDKYDALRQAARNKRDAAIREVRADFRRELLAIRRLRDSLEEGPPAKARGPKPRLGGPKWRTMPELVRSYMPRDRTFTISELIETLREVEPDRRWRRDSLRVTFMNLRRSGEVRRVKRMGKSQVLWEAVDAQPKETPFVALLLPEAVAVVLGENGPMRPVEIVVALQARGYRRDANPKILSNSLGATLKRCEARFKCGDEGKWTTIP